MIRAVQMIVLSALVDIVIPINLFIFLEVCIKFAQMDIVGGEDIIANNLTFYPTAPVNDAFDFFGVGDKNMISNSGSYFFILAGIIGFSLFKALEVCIKFAQMDIVGGEDIIAENLTFYPTEPVNAAFDFFGVGDKNMISNSGSYFFILAGIIGFSLFKAFVNWLATKIASNHYVRLMGMWAYQD